LAAVPEALTYLVVFELLLLPITDFVEQYLFSLAKKNIRVAGGHISYYNKKAGRTNSYSRWPFKDGHYVSSDTNIKTNKLRVKV
jgi:hypothetical protein